MEIYQYKVMFGDKFADGFINIEAETEDEASEKACTYIGDKLCEAFPELDIEYGWELLEEDDFDEEEE